tara:strand:- start:5633 stop:5761 length:129 start_codon:yes stop_codon:yes gene_type:complete
MITFTKEEDYGNEVEVRTATIDPTNLGAIWRLERDGWIRKEA